MVRLIVSKILLLLVVFSYESYAYDVLVHVNGRIIENTCTISPSDKDKVISFGTVDKKEFGKPGLQIKKTSININFENCSESIESVKLKLSGNPDTIDSNTLLVNGDKYMGFSILFLTLDDEQLNLNGDAKVINFNDGKDKSITFSASLNQTTLDVSEGAFSARATFEVEYQ
ncbi:fimbrial protein [Photobacterium leiognathi]|uniref:fimbrial protein n=1 Tax=Photobacterium leiognathi TaxID=553611 RepID=UPI0027324315|nr:fimbrial protein [Photobacterium leiognathi]